ncbi:MAG: GTP-binding protein, partial [Promethearchaeia archaeon]
RAKLQIWDTGGQERFSSIRPMYYRGALGALLIFDLTSISSFEHLPQWIEEVRANVQTDIPLLLVGNKSDLLNQRAISLEEINDFTRDFNLYYMETSAKTGDNVGDCFSVLACLMIGEGVPGTLLGDAIYSPGKIPVIPQQETLIPPEEASVTEYEEPSIPEQPTATQPEYVAPPEPEPEPQYQEPEPQVQQPEPSQASEPVFFEPQGQYEQAEPPQSQPEVSRPESQASESVVFEPEDQYEQAEPPQSQSEVPETRSQASEPIFFEPNEQEVEPDIPVPEPSFEPTEKSSEFEFKTPEQIMAEDNDIQQEAAELSSLPQMPKQSATESYKPKSIPFSSRAPTPTEGPEKFKASPPPASSQPESKSTESLFDYMPKEPEIKESKKGFGLFSRRKKKEVEKPEEELESQPKVPSLLDSLSGKSPKSEERSQPAFIPFSTSAKTSQSEESKEVHSGLRIIPNAETIEEEANDFVEMTKETSASKAIEEEAPKMVTCSNCGARLSSEYAFCNKCGSKL